MSISVNPDEPSQSPQSQVRREGAPVESAANTETPRPWENTADMSAPQHWREVAQRIENEKNPTKVIELAQQLIDMIDEGKLGKGTG